MLLSINILKLNIESNIIRRYSAYSQAAMLILSFVCKSNMITF